ATPHRLDAWLTSVQASAPPSEVEKDAGYRGVRPASSPLHAPWGAALPWNQRQLWPGIGGSCGLESAAALLWNQWQHSCGTGGSFAVELVAGFTWNRWQLWRGIRTPVLGAPVAGGPVGVFPPEDSGRPHSDDGAPPHPPSLP